MSTKGYEGIGSGGSGFSQGLETEGPFLYISGQVPRQTDGTPPEDTSAEGQFRQIFANLTEVLGAAGLKIEDLVLVRAYLSDRSHWPAFKTVREEFFAGHKPAMTAIVAGLADPSWVAEIEGVATLSGR